VQTIHGRRHYLTRQENYIAVNRVCQGSVADEIKSRMVALHKAFKAEGIDAKVTLQIHDDIRSEVPLEQRYKAAPLIHRVMHESSMPYKLTLPSSLDITYTTWSDLKEIKDVHKLPEPPPPSHSGYRSERWKFRDEPLLINPQEAGTGLRY
jgi:DNA polymerase I-like protein with 3'-5' exonuclease and polymerase domains